jgi:uncharacterized protein (TIGR00730 family)
MAEAPLSPAAPASPGPGESGASPATQRLTRQPASTGVPEVDKLLRELLDQLGVTLNRDQLHEMLVTIVRLASGHADRLDLKIVNVALKEMREGFEVFAPYRNVRKVTMFGSARTEPEDPLYTQARNLASRLAGLGWSTVTGAGPGIMAAGLEGAGPEHSFGINIRLPFEQEPNQFIASDPKLVSMKYFFTRKLLLVKESDGYAVLPGGFGTLDETFELLTLLQTGKAMPAPVVLLDAPGGRYWQAWSRFVADEVASRGFVSQEDSSLFLVTDDVGKAAAEIVGFYRNYHSLRWVGSRLVLRLHSRPTGAEVASLSQQFSDILLRGGIELLDGPLPAEAREDDHPGLARIAMVFDRHSYERLRRLIDALNALPSAPPAP